MAYDQNSTDALDQQSPGMDQGMQSGMGDMGEEQAKPGEAQDTFFIPQDILGGRKYKEGDKITLEVMGSDEDGDLEVCFPGAGGNWHDELRSELSNAGGA